MKTNSRTVFLVIFATVLAICLPAGFAKIPSITIRSTGYYGTCLNQSHGIEARLHLVIHKMEEVLSGTLTITGGLVGSGPITGTIEGDTVMFTTSGEDFGDIIWSGRIEGKAIRGSYVVESPDGSNQHGIWNATRK